MNRRQFSQSVSLGAVGAVALARAAEVSSPAKSEKKQWAHEHLKGLGSLIMPSFTADFKALDEEAIRLDVRHSIKQGFTSVTPSANGCTQEQSRRMFEVISEEARGKTGIGCLGGNLVHAEALGSTYAMVGFPRNGKAQTEDDVYTEYRKIIDTTSMAIVLYGSPVESLRRLHPSGIPLNVFDRLADHPQVVGMKLTHPMNAGTAFEICERLSDRLIMGPINFDLLPVLSKNYKNVQWSGLWITDALQSPEKPYAVEFMDLLIKQRTAEAMKVYWQMEPLIQGIYDLQAPLLLHGSHPWPHMKYLQWVTGGNGGLLPLKPAEYLPVLDARSRELIKTNFRKAGIAPVDRPDEEFMVGKVAYAKGVRASELSDKPLYALG